MTRPARITWAAAVILIGSGIALTAGIVALPIPGEDRTISIAFVVAGTSGIITGIGILRLQRWARRFILIFSGLAAYFGSAVAPIVLSLRVPAPPEVPGQIPDQVTIAMKVTFFAACLILTAVGVWWAYLFSRDTTKESFGTPTSVRSRPFSISVIGWYLVISGISSALSLLSIRRNPAMMAFGSVFTGWTAIVVFVLYSAVHLYLGIGLLRHRQQSRGLAMYYCLFQLLNVAVFFLRPDREDRVTAYHDLLVASGTALDTQFSPGSLSSFLRLVSIEGSVFALLALWFLAMHRNSFGAQLESMQSDTIAGG